MICIVSVRHKTTRNHGIVFNLSQYESLTETCNGVIFYIIKLCMYTCIYACGHCPFPFSHKTMVFITAPYICIFSQHSSWVYQKVGQQSRAAGEQRYYNYLSLK